MEYLPCNFWSRFSMFLYGHVTLAWVKRVICPAPQSLPGEGRTFSSFSAWHIVLHSKDASTLVTLPRTVTPYCECGRDSWPRNVSKVGYAVTLQACSVGCRYLAIASKVWYSYGLSRCGRTKWHVTTVRSSARLFTSCCIYLGEWC